MCVQGWVPGGGGRELLGSPPSPTLGPRQGQGAGQGDNMPSLLVYLNHPDRTSSKFNILVGSSLFFKYHKLLLITHYNLMNHHGICRSLHTKTCITAVHDCVINKLHINLCLLFFKQRNIISSLKYIGVFFIHLKFLYEDWYLNSLKIQLKFQIKTVILWQWLR